MSIDRKGELAINTLPGGQEKQESHYRYMGRCTVAAERGAVFVKRDKCTSCNESSGSLEKKVFCVSQTCSLPIQPTYADSYYQFHAAPSGAGKGFI